ncbi:hypothetical protein ACFQ7F_17720 [Streptomyces sp. NPDC056486]|uniref:hypothetical protein n=1 Tax=Streptomyces sp. NPDC056486 TaxID=3345835 RepID=UPI0036B0C5FD
MKKRSVLAVVTFAAGAVIAAISPPPGADTADTAGPVHTAGALDELGDVEQWTDSTPSKPAAEQGVVAPDISSTQRL